MGHSVQETNDNCTVSKSSMVAQGYFQDEYINFISPKSKRRCPLINIGYYVRAVVVEEAISYFFNVVKNFPSQVVSLGAGFDTTYFRLASNFENITYFEVDLVDVVKHKKERIKNTNSLLMKLKNVKEISNGLVSDNYCLIAQDIGIISELEKALIDVGLKIEIPTLFLSECAITYLEEIKSRDIISWASSFSNVVFIIYEQIYPDDGFSQAMMKHYDNLNLPLWSVQVYRSKEDQINRFKKCKYEKSWSAGAFEIYRKILSCDTQEAVLNKEPFDEWEEWHLTSSHYTLSLGTKGLFNQSLSSFIASYNIDEYSPAPLPLCDWELQKSVTLQFFGHTAIEIWEKSAILVIGGFGLSQDYKHMRLSQICLISLPEMEVTYHTPPNIDDVSWDCVHHTTSVLSDSAECTEFLLFGGRLSPLRTSNKKPFRISVSRKGNNEIIIRGRQLKTTELGPHPRRRHTATKVLNSTLVFGGIWTDPDSKRQKIFDDIWLLTKDEAWVKLESKPCGRFSHSAVSHNEIVYIVGGIGDKTKNFKTLGDIWTYNITDNIWAQLEINIIPRYGLTCHMSLNHIFLIGGVNELSEKQPGIALISLSDLSVSEFKLPGSSRDLPIMVHNHASVVAPNQKNIILVGGGGHCFSFGTYFNKHPIIIKLPEIK